MSVRVYILTEISNTRAKLVADTLFSDGIFEVVIPGFELLPKNLAFLETNKVLHILIHSKKESPDKPVLIVKDTSTSTGPDQIAKSIKRVIDPVKSEPFDLFYLCRWLDRCDLNSTVDTFDNKLTSLIKTKYAKGIQAVMFSVQGRDKIISMLQNDFNLEIEDFLQKKSIDGILIAFGSNPNLIDYDISLADDRVKNSFKTTTCGIVSNNNVSIMKKDVTVPVLDPDSSYNPGYGPKACTTGSNNIGVYIFIIIVIIIVLILFRRPRV